MKLNLKNLHKTQRSLERTVLLPISIAYLVPGPLPISEENALGTSLLTSFSDKIHDIHYVILITVKNLFIQIHSFWK